MGIQFFSKCVCGSTSTLSLVASITPSGVTSNLHNSILPSPFSFTSLLTPEAYNCFSHLNNLTSSKPINSQTGSISFFDVSISSDDNISRVSGFNLQK